MKPIRILALIEASFVTGPAKNLLEFARTARNPESGLPAVEVCVANYRRDPRGEPDAFIRAAIEADVPAESIVERRRFDLGVVPQLRSIVARRRPDIIQTHNIKSHLLVRWAGFWREMPWVAFHHGYTKRDALDRSYSQLDRFSLRAARRIVTVCRPFAADLARYGIPIERIWVRHNSVRPFSPPPPESVDQVRARFGVAPGAPVVLVVGRLSQEKGQLDLVEALALLLREHAALELRVLMVGDGPDRTSIESRAAALGISDRVILCGHQSDVAPFYALASAVAIPSHSEGSPNVLLEAMAAGVPLAAAAVGGVPEIASDNETALLVRSQDPAALARALYRLLSERDFAGQLARRAREHVSADFTPEAHCRALVRFFQSVLGNQGKLPV
jgi:glycosyltransferase involved in cell wall biosynthesis